MPTYVAITRHNGQWEYVCSGPDANEVYLEAEEIIVSREVYPEEETAALAPETEAHVDHLRVVPEDAARDVYHVAFTQDFQD